METKICTKCKLEKSISEFHRSSKSKDGHTYQCKTCRNPGKKKFARSIEDEREHRRQNEQKRRQNNPQGILLCAAKRRAKEKNLEFSLSLSDIIIPNVCPVFNIQLNTKLNCVNDNSPTIDRIDNSRGYTVDNIIIVSDRVNRLKRDATLDELKKLLRYMKEGNT